MTEARTATDPMTCDDIQQLLLSLELDEDSRRGVFEALAHLQSCEPCQLALRDYDKLTALLGTGEDLDEALPAIDRLDEHHQPSTTADSPPTLADQASVSPTGGWEAFEKKLLAAARGGRQRGGRQRGGRQGPVSMRIHWWLGALGSVAAMVALAWGAYHLGKNAPGARGETPVVNLSSVGTPNSTLVRLSPDDLAEKVRIFFAIDHTLDGRARWLMLSGLNSIDVGLIDQCPQGPTTRGIGDKILLVRLNLVCGNDVVSQADVLIVAGTTANVVVPTDMGVPLRYHIVTSALDPMRLRVQVQVPGEAGAVEVATSHQAVSASATAVLGTSLDLEPYLDASAGRIVLGRQTFDLQVAAAAASSSLPG
jgi:hypothetical protein